MVWRLNKNSWQILSQLVFIAWRYIRKSYSKKISSYRHSRNQSLELIKSVLFAKRKNILQSGDGSDSKNTPPYFYRLTVTRFRKMFSQWDLSGDGNFQGDGKKCNRVTVTFPKIKCPKSNFVKNAKFNSIFPKEKVCSIILSQFLVKPKWKTTPPNSKNLRVLWALWQRVEYQAALYSSHQNLSLLEGI